MNKNDDYPKNQFYSDWNISDDEMPKNQLKETGKDIKQKVKDESKEIKDKSKEIRNDIKKTIKTTGGKGMKDM